MTTNAENTRSPTCTALPLRPRPGVRALHTGAQQELWALLTLYPALSITNRNNPPPPATTPKRMLDRPTRTLTTGIATRSDTPRSLSGHGSPLLSLSSAMSWYSLAYC